MKKIYLLISGLLLLGISANANNSTNTYSNQDPFVFLENGVEYAVFNNGEFDFNIIPRKSANISINTHNINLSFNSGRNYQPYIQKDRQGFITRINSTPIFYDRYGKVNRIGNIAIHYNYRGMVSSIGNLNVYYNNYGVVYHRRGYINRNNINYRPRYQFYKRTPVRKTIVYKNSNKRNYKYYSKNNKKTNRSHKYYNKSKSSNNSSKYKNKSSGKTKASPQKSTKKESYRQNSNSYRRNSSSSSRYTSN